LIANSAAVSSLDFAVSSVGGDAGAGLPIMLFPFL
jgi:hypothetical protein